MHRESLSKHGHSPHTLFWGSRGIQKIRFRVLSEIGIESGDSLLDVGCGFAELYGWLGSQGITVDYSGIDLSPDILARAGALHNKLSGGLRLQCGDLFDFDWPECSFDWVVLSGTLNWQLDDGGNYARRVIQRMFALCRRGVAFNMLNAKEQDMRALPDLVAYDRENMLDFCRSLAPESRCRDDYLENDFTIYMHKPQGRLSWR
ncbi:MAG: class I SAM-dependent methyltransferase, partial [Mariprofundaceae bacterium]